MTLATNLKRFMPFASIYQSSKFMEADMEIREYLSLDIRSPLPFVIPHGVDFPGVFSFCDAYLAEPIYWSYNKEIHELISCVKSSVLAPHPWIITMRNNPDLKFVGQKSLVVGPPPSMTNDIELLRIIKKSNLNPSSILIKPRGKYVPDSIAFWRSHGFATYTAHSYRDLLQILSLHCSLICTYASSVIYFAGSFGMNLHVLGDYSFYAYDNVINSNHLNLVNFARFILKAGSDRDYFKAESDRVLGNDLALSKNELLGNIVAVLNNEQRFFYSPRSLSRPKHFFYSILLRLGAMKPSFYTHGIRHSIVSKFFFLCSMQLPLYLIKSASINHLAGGNSQICIRQVRLSDLARPGFGAEP